ncbi:hypothetical protein FHU38_000975 [Saccharomonospora amisosensis]|uniref:Uncharacterized protein n=1 Tax=Saccharomonospora amisosensis TaxID=1128677 RepID=A0A7X5ZPM8_9PSEU|nr:hypothetical protein [Saccharomonospora amisosensis]NIJ10631.1 hypothetical protein [Saccharomonospora amisosensis]
MPFFAGQKLRASDLIALSIDAHGRWYAPGGQSIAASTDTPLQFNNITTATPLVTVTGTGNSIFTLQRDGVWEIHAGIRHNGANVLQLSIYEGAGGFSLAALRASDSGTPTAACSLNRYFTAGSAIRVNAWHPTTAATVSSTGESTHLDITYRGMWL